MAVEGFISFQSRFPLGSIIPVIRAPSLLHVIIQGPIVTVRFRHSRCFQLRSVPELAVIATSFPIHWADWIVRKVSLPLTTEAHYVR